MTRPTPKRQQPPAVCPVCGEDVPPTALACPECGADHNSGWREDAATYDGVNVEDDFDYEEFTQREFGSSVKPTGIRPVWWITAIVALALMILYFVVSR